MMWMSVTIIKKNYAVVIGMVLQDGFLFAGTVMDNIRYGRLEATEEECIAAAKMANAHSFIHRLPKGYNTVLTERGGEYLSRATPVVDDC